MVKPVGYRQGARATRWPSSSTAARRAPWTNGWSYRWNPQTYAGQGFAVVTINFHGSTGYGQAFTNSISGDWGGKPLQDLKLGWQARAGPLPFLDGDRACALGASYGGYMVYWMAGVWNQPWKCFVDHDGVFDTRAMYYATEELWFEEKENGGPQFEHPENYETFNPVNHVKDWRVPMLVVHSGHDYRIPDHPGSGRVHRAAAARHPQRVPDLPGRKPLGAQAAEQRAMARNSQRLAETLDRHGQGSLKARTSPAPRWEPPPLWEQLQSRQPWSCGELCRG